MRILAAADLHGVSTAYEWIVAWARGASVDAVALAGDLLPSDFAEEQRKKAERIAQTLRRCGCPVLYIMGNDDHVTLGADDEQLVPIHGRLVGIGGYRFVGYQYTPPFIGDTFVKPEEEIEADLAEFDPLIDGSTVLVTHTPAWGALDLSFEEHAGSPAVAALLQRRPALAHIHGHIHGRFGRKDNQFNVASAGMCRAMVIELPSLRHAVIAHSAGLLPWVMYASGEA